MSTYQFDVSVPKRIKCGFLDDSPVFAFIFKFVIFYLFLAIITIGVFEPLLKYATDGKITLQSKICNCCKIHDLEDDGVVTLFPPK